MKQFVNLKKMGLTAFCFAAGIFFVVAYFAGSNVWAANGSAGKGVVIKTDDKQYSEANGADKNAFIPPTGADFIKVTEKCARCHAKQFSSMDTLKEAKWVVPGKPEISPIYKVIGKNKKKDGVYHNMTESEKSTIYSYIKNMK